MDASSWWGRGTCGLMRPDPHDCEPSLQHETIRHTTSPDFHFNSATFATTTNIHSRISPPSNTGFEIHPPAPLFGLDSPAEALSLINFSPPPHFTP